MEQTDVLWWKSSRSSGGGNGDCVEVAVTDRNIMVRDSRYPTRGLLCYQPSGWTAFLAAVKTGQLSPPQQS